VAALFLLAALPDRPWGWVSFSDLDALPANVCAAVGDRAPDVVGAGRGELSDSGRTDVQRLGCEWVVEGMAVKVTLTRYFRSGLHSGGSVAATHVLEAGPGVAAWSSGKVAEIPGARRRLGTDVLSGYLDFDAAATVVMRHRNVIVDAVVGWGPDEVGPAEEERLFALVKATLAALDA
jgi:hypothetical protein